MLDLFAGTGQMGIEALSRGAADAVFVDTRRDCADVIRKNLERTRFTDVGTVELTDFRAYVKRAEPESFGLIFLDPPMAPECSGRQCRRLCGVICSAMVG